MIPVPSVEKLEDLYLSGEQVFLNDEGLFYKHISFDDLLSWPLIVVLNYINASQIFYEE